MKVHTGWRSGSSDVAEAEGRQASLEFFSMRLEVKVLAELSASLPGSGRSG